MSAELSTRLTCEHRRTTVTVRPQVWVGIDVGKLSHHACAVDETGKVVWTQKVANEQRAVEAVIERAQKSAEKVQWAIDLTSPIASMLITVLMAADEAVAYVPGRVVNTMTNAFPAKARPTPRMRGWSLKPPACEPISPRW
jgi:hypothetical protein